MKIVEKLHAGERRVYFYCPGCKHAHNYVVPRWTYNENPEEPTFRPSLRVFYPVSEHGPEKTLCHLFVSGGMIRFLDDCVHELAGKTVPMVEFPPDYSL